MILAFFTKSWNESENREGKTAFLDMHESNHNMV